MKFIAKYYGKRNRLIYIMTFEAESWDEAGDISMSKHWELIKSGETIRNARVSCYKD